jgi:RHS repeat-associated protein
VGNLAATYTYSPYGTATGTAAGVNPFHYLGAYQTGGTTGNQLFGYRWYDFNWGRFTSTDPTRQEANNYAYAQGDPINRSDPKGDFSFLEGSFHRRCSSIIRFRVLRFAGCRGRGNGRDDNRLQRELDRSRIRSRVWRSSKYC